MNKIVKERIENIKERIEKAGNWECPECGSKLEKCLTKDMLPGYKGNSISRCCTNEKCEFWCTMD